MQTDYDVIISGGGMAGLITASAIAKFTNQKFSILVIERNPKVDAGKKTVSGWICGMR